MSDCVVCVLTPPGRAAVASVVVEGQGAAAVAARFFRAAGAKSLDQAPWGRILYGEWRSENESFRGAAGEGVVVCRTAAERVEIHCHGGKAAVRAIVGDLAGAGCREVDWREWWGAAEADSFAAGARVALAEVRTQRAAAILLDQYRGALRAAIDATISALDAGNSADAMRRLDELLRYAPLGLHLTTPWRIVLAGRPNVGKSSLINALVGYRRSIVHDTPGVTRDVVTASTALDGWPVELADTAGVRASRDALEAAGVAKTLGELQTADLVLLVFDAAAPWSENDAQLLSAAPGSIVVHNKCDLAAALTSDRPAGIQTSALTGEGVSELKQALVERLVPHVPSPGRAVPFTLRQIEALRAARHRAETGNPAAAALLLGESAHLGSD